jgi:hypothetical protein
MYRIQDRLKETDEVLDSSKHIIRGMKSLGGAFANMFRKVPERRPEPTRVYPQRLSLPTAATHSDDVSTSREERKFCIFSLTFSVCVEYMRCEFMRKAYCVVVDLEIRGDVIPAPPPPLTHTHTPTHTDQLFEALQTPL